MNLSPDSERPLTLHLVFGGFLPTKPAGGLYQSLLIQLITNIGSKDAAVMEEVGEIQFVGCEFREFQSRPPFRTWYSICNWGTCNLDQWQNSILQTSPDLITLIVDVSPLQIRRIRKCRNSPLGQDYAAELSLSREVFTHVTSYITRSTPCTLFYIWSMTLDI